MIVVVVVMMMMMVRKKNDGWSHGLVCWHCIADNCDMNPEENSRAEQKSCLEGQTCQKVFFEMESDIDDNKYRSTVRSCADECIPHNDFINCSSELRTTRGCVKRACCNDDDLCNSGDATHSQPWTVVYRIWFLLVIRLVFRRCHLV
ncbi:unnamed protein product [Candidula unifasciata]|uniref:Uncharacterized protein n=1 Tax=Candidula unifasciata TaxID=100452 RepID=A0A8S3ZXL3_9EUPU|nr:unnamed protein product [Candidula unifasciata]